MKILKALVLLLIISTSTLSAQTKWKLDNSHSNVMFNVTHLVISEVTGFFKDYSAEFTSKSDNDFNDASVTFVVKTASINTDNQKRDDHLKSDDFFNAEKYPEMKFVSTSMKKSKGNKYKLTGNLTIRDVTKKVTFDVDYLGTVKDPWGNTKVAFKLTGTINRFDYNLKWNTLMETGGAVVGKDVKIVCNIEFAKDTGK